MFTLKKHIIGVAASVLLLASYGNALEIDLGPFNFQIGGSIERDPVCQAIANKNLVEVFVMTDESDEAVTKRLVVEPYELGFNSKKELVLRGFHVEGVAFPEEMKKEKAEGNKGIVGGIFTVFQSKEGVKEFKIKNVSDIRVLSNTNFKIREPSELGKGEGDAEIVEMICSIFHT